MTATPAPRIATAAKSHIVIVTASSRWRAAYGWLGIVAGAALFVAALAVPLDEGVLLMALALKLRGGLATLDTE
jgi:hypothetical protein